MNVIRTLAFSSTLIISSIPLAGATALPIPDCWHRPKGYDIELTSTRGNRVPDLHDSMGRFWPQKGHNLCHEGGGYGGAITRIDEFRRYYCNCLKVGVSVSPVEIGR